MVISTIPRVFKALRNEDVTADDDPTLDDFVPDSPVTVAYSPQLPPEPRRARAEFVGENAVQLPARYSDLVGDDAYLAARFKGKAQPLKAALLDQRNIAGLGNIYVCEALHRSHLSPKRAASTLAKRSGAPSDHAVRLVEAIRAVLNAAIEAGGSSLRDHRRTDGELGYFQHSFRVYDREGAACPKRGCGGTIERIVQSGRSTYYCPTCQR